MLGHPVSFAYCRQCSDALPCRKIMDCWFQRIDVQGFLSACYTPEEIARILAPPKPKILQIVEMARKAQRKVS